MRCNKWSFKGKNMQFEVCTIMVLAHHVSPKMGADYFPSVMKLSGHLS